jgi:hypothetical protein
MKKGKRPFTAEEQADRYFTFKLCSGLGAMASILSFFGASRADRNYRFYMICGCISAIVLIYCIYTMANDCYREQKQKRRDSSLQPQPGAQRACNTDLEDERTKPGEEQPQHQQCCVKVHSRCSHPKCILNSLRICIVKSKEIKKLNAISYAYTNGGNRNSRVTKHICKPEIDLRNKYFDTVFCNKRIKVCRICPRCNQKRQNKQQKNNSYFCA